MTIHALTAKGEAQVTLHPTTRHEQYIRWVKEFLSLKATGSPGGYPVFIQRWTRMAQVRNNLEKLLLLGEPEAIVAIVHTPNLSYELACRAWWVSPTAHNARRLLEKPSVITSHLGKELAKFLLELLPFEEHSLDAIDTVRLCLQDQLVDEDERQHLWQRAKRKPLLYVSFLFADPSYIPLTLPVHPQAEAINTQLHVLLAENNPYALLLCQLLSPNGQKWLKTLQLALEKPNDQEVVIALFIALQRYCGLPWPEPRGVRDISLVVQRAQQYCDLHTNTPLPLQAVIGALTPTQLPLLHALLVLSQLGEDSLIPYFGGNDAVGSVMRKRLQPLTQPIFHHLSLLLT